LLVSGSYTPPSIEALFFYDSLAFEVFQYESAHLWAHPAATHAFGIDTRVMAAAAAASVSAEAAEAANNNNSSSSSSSPFRSSKEDDTNKDDDDHDWDVLFIGAFADHVGHKRPTMIGTSDKFQGAVVVII
jgi:hypothetical protein